MPKKKENHTGDFAASGVGAVIAIVLAGLIISGNWHWGAWVLLSIYVVIGFTKAVSEYKLLRKPTLGKLAMTLVVTAFWPVFMAFFPDWEYGG